MKKIMVTLSPNSPINEFSTLLILHFMRNTFDKIYIILLSCKYKIYKTSFLLSTWVLQIKYKLFTKMIKNDIKMNITYSIKKLKLENDKD